MPTPFAPPGAVFRTLLWDRHGRLVLGANYCRYTITLPNKSMIEVSEGSSIVLVDGTVVTLAGLGNKDSIPLGVCELCRYPPFSLFKTTPPTHGIVSLPNLHTCAGGCGQPFCPRHGSQCSDGLWRCSECLDKWSLTQSFVRVGRILLGPFFRREE